jgi:hypothetical protein
LERHLKNERLIEEPKFQVPPLPSLPESPQEQMPGEPGKLGEDAQLQKAIELLKAWEIFKGYLNPPQINPIGSVVEGTNQKN